MIAPNLEELLALRGAAQGLRLPSRRPAHASHAGAYRSAHRGRGLEFQEVRPYVSGDDPRTIDWRVTARRGRPHTKLFREERERPVWLLADLGAAMFFGTRRQLKSSVVVRAAALVAWSAVQTGDRVGALIAGSSSYRILPPRAREAGVLPLLATLIDMQPTAPSASPSGCMKDGVNALLPLVHPGSMVIALSDFAVLDSDTAAAWAALAVHNDLRLFWVTDPLESEGLPNGRFRIGLPGRSVSLDGSSTRAAWRAKWHEREAKLEELAHHIATPIVRLDTSQPVEETLRTVLAVRRTAA
ncbi:MAG: hypothetical protein JWL65_7577 [Gammaproteobacteria bacterium]|nr:hypothetical protein [Gammaproteobacteria bacterium]